LAGIAIGFGVMLRLAADFVLARAGGTITGFEPGDVLEPDFELKPDDAGEAD
jgi:hypothetical protein